MVTFEVCDCDTHTMHGQLLRQNERPVCFSPDNMNWRHYLNLWTWSFSKSRQYEFVRTNCVAVIWCYEVPKSFVLFLFGLRLYVIVNNCSVISGRFPGLV